MANTDRAVSTFIDAGMVKRNQSANAHAYKGKIREKGMKSGTDSGVQLAHISNLRCEFSVRSWRASSLFRKKHGHISTYRAVLKKDADISMFIQASS